MTERLLVALLAAALAFPAGAQTLEKIRKTGAITLGYIDGAAPFSYLEGNKPEGYSVDLCRAVADGIAAQLGRKQLATRWVKLTIQNRVQAVRQKRVDLECSTTTWTLGRQKLVDFSLMTFVDGGSVLVKIADKARRLADFGGRSIAVIRGTTTEKALQRALKDVKDARMKLVASRAEGIELLRRGEVDGFASDRTTLIGLVLKQAGGEAYRLLDDDFSIEQYALMLPRGDPDFRLAVNRSLARLYRTQEVNRIYDRWLRPLGPPSLLLSATYFIQGLAE